MSGVWGKKIKLSIFGESHGEGIGIVIDGIKPGIKIDLNEIEKDLQRRAPGKNKMSTQRNESDKPKILSGIFNEITTGTPISMIIKNEDKKSRDYSKTKDLMRPGHADFSGFKKYNGFNDYRGGGHFSGRLTAPLVFAGALAKQILKEKGIFVRAHIKKIGNIEDKNFDFVNLKKIQFDEILKKELAVIDDSKINDIKNEIQKYKDANDSVGGIIECAAIGVKAGIGDPFFDSLESTIAHLAFSVPAVKGIDFGIGFDFANRSGLDANDEMYMNESEVKTYTNNNGGIIGGITNGMPVVFNTVIKPTPSISQKQKTVNIKTMKNEEISIIGRHDPCIVQRAVVVIESIMAISILEHL